MALASAHQAGSLALARDMVQAGLGVALLPPALLRPGMGWLPLDGHPVKFFRPGSKGFESTQPIFDCDAILSQNSKEGLTHDQL